MALCLIASHGRSGPTGELFTQRLRELVGEFGGDADIEEVVEIVSSGTELDVYAIEAIHERRHRPLYTRLAVATGSADDLRSALSSGSDPGEEDVCRAVPGLWRGKGEDGRESSSS